MLATIYLTDISRYTNSNISLKKIFYLVKSYVITYISNIMSLIAQILFKIRDVKMSKSKPQ